MYSSDARYNNRRLPNRRGVKKKKSFNSAQRAQMIVVAIGVFLLVLSIIILKGMLLPSVSRYGDGVVNGNIAIVSNKIQERINEMNEYTYFGTSVLDIESYKPLGGGRYSEWRDGDTPYKITPDVMKKSDELARERREHIKNAMKHAWKGYREHAFGEDEVQPLSGIGNARWQGLGTTLVDSLDTLWLMGMKEDFYEARDWLKEALENDLHNVPKAVSTFETTIRSLGGYLAAYDWSGDEVFLNAAKDLADRLLPAFDSPSGLPWNTINLSTGEGKNERGARHENNIASVGTLQLEFRYLAMLTGDEKYSDKPMIAFDKLESLKNKNGLYASGVINDRSEPEPGRAYSLLTFGGNADSFYEYMLKLWLQGDKKDTRYRKMYDESMDGLHKVLLRYSKPNGLAYIAIKHADLPIRPRRDARGQIVAPRKRKAMPVMDNMEHLACFMGGLLTLGAYTDPNGLDSERAQRDLRTAKALGYTCYQMYASTETGLSPEVASGLENRSSRESHLERRIRRRNAKRRRSLHEKRKKDQDLYVKKKAEYYLLRPETVESLYILNKFTGDPIYREWGWEIFQSIEKYCKTDIAYGQYEDVTKASAGTKDSMESFFLGETLKYLYLLFDPDSPVDIGKHVFNTEAHPLRMFNFSEK